MHLLAPRLLDALLLGTVSATILVGPALLLGRHGGWSGHLRKRILGASVLGSVLTFALAATAAPGPIGCLVTPCGGDAHRAEAAGRASFAQTAAAAGKFDDVAASVPRVAPASSPDLPTRARSLALAVWIAGVLMCLARVGRRRWLAFGIVRTARPVRDESLGSHFDEVAERVGVARRVALLQHSSLSSPVVAGVIHPALLLPTRADGGADLDPDEAEIVFLHELAHIRRGDPAVTLACELAAALLWFHPLVACAARRIRHLQELSADSDVLSGGVRPSDYASYLLHAVRRFAGQARELVDQHPIAGDCIMEARLRTILDPHAPHEPPRARTAATITAIALCLSAAIVFAPLALQASGGLARGASGSYQVRKALLDSASLDSVLRPVIIDHMADRYIAGAAVAVVHGTEVVYQAGFGRREIFHEIPVETGRTIWRIGSISKALTGIAVMQLVDAGRLELDRDVNDYFDVPIVPRDRPEPVTVRHLLTHTAGFDQVGLGRHAEGPDDVRPMEAFLREYLSRIRAPGILSTYDTYGITLAGLLIERVSGRSYADYLDRRIFEPLRMHRSGITVPPALAEDVAVGYSFAGHWEAEPWEYMNTPPASSVNASVPDMANLAIMLLNEGRFEGRQVLEGASARAMLSPQFTNHPDQPGYGLTFWEDRGYGVPAFSHGGSMAGYGSFLYLVPQHDLGIFVAYNQESGSLPDRVIATVVSALFPGRAGPTVRPPLDHPVDPARFEGTYANSLYHHGDPETGWKRAPFELLADEQGRLVFGGAPARAVGPAEFQRDDGVLLTFLTDESGAVTHLVVNQAVYEKLN
jgi:CubicO group peptidase (beta-lactamase class C family)